MIPVQSRPMPSGAVSTLAFALAPGDLSATDLFLLVPIADLDCPTRYVLEVPVRCEALRVAECHIVKVRNSNVRLQTLNLERRQTMKRICSITLLAFFFLAGNCFALNFISVEVISENRQVDGWYFGANLVASPPSSSYSASVSFESGTASTCTYPLTYIDWLSLAVYDAGKLSGDPTSYDGQQVTWTLNDGTETISATGMVPIICPNPPACFNPIRQVALSTDFTATGDPLHPTISWHNPDKQIQYYRVRLLDSSNRLLWQSANLPYIDLQYGENPTYTIPVYDATNPAKGYDLQPGTEYVFRIEAREQWWFPVTGTGLDLLPTFGSPNRYADLMNRSTSVFPYTVPGPEPEPALVDLHPDVFEVKVVRTKKAHGQERIFLSAYLGLPEGYSESELSPITLSLDGTIIAPEVSRKVFGNVLHVRFLLDTNVVSAILGLPAREISLHQDKIKVNVLTAPTVPIELVELTISDGSTFVGRSAVRIMIDNE